MKKVKMTSIALAVGAAAVFALTPVVSVAADSGKAPCYGVNSCKGKSACKTASNACKGQNACKGKGMKMMSAKRCAKKGGSATESAADGSAASAPADGATTSK
ncbi:hypothetical protein AYO45_03295 [Gammaproteobacteria bacterium SCGC AG-212-F23]|nr:hypothetical protein AYO45_03295 [Gammaproteobacteria bacterium SCGC AG-212-F23]